MPFWKGDQPGRPVVGQLVEAHQSQGAEKMDREYGELLGTLRKLEMDRLSIRGRGIIRSGQLDDIEANIAFVKSQIGEREKVLATAYVASLDQKRQAAKSKEADIQAAFKAQEKAALELNSKSADLVRMESDVKRAEEVLAALEKGEQSGAVTRLADDLPLFAAAPPRPTAGVARAVESEVEKALAAVNPDELTPKQALELLYELRRLKDG